MNIDEILFTLFVVVFAIMLLGVLWAFIPVFSEGRAAVDDRLAKVLPLGFVSMILLDVALSVGVGLAFALWCVVGQLAWLLAVRYLYVRFNGPVLGGSGAPP